MDVDADKLEVLHDPKVGRFKIEVEGLKAVLDYEMQGNAMIFTHTGVPRPLEGQGVGGRLAKTALEYARVNSHKVVPACEFMYVYIRRHPEYQEMVVE